MIFRVLTSFFLSFRLMLGVGVFALVFYIWTSYSSLNHGPVPMIEAPNFVAVQHILSPDEFVDPGVYQVPRSHRVERLLPPSEAFDPSTHGGRSQTNEPPPTSVEDILKSYARSQKASRRGDNPQRVVRIDFGVFRTPSQAFSFWKDIKHKLKLSLEQPILKKIDRGAGRGVIYRLTFKRQILESDYRRLLHYFRLKNVPYLCP